jgi:hypothetical protein
VEPVEQLARTLNRTVGDAGSLPTGVLRTWNPFGTGGNEMSRRAVSCVSQCVSGEIVGLAQLGVPSSVRDVACEDAGPDGNRLRGHANRLEEP